MSGVAEATVAFTAAKIAGDLSVNFSRWYSEGLQIQRVFGGLYPLDGFLFLEVGYCIGKGGEGKNKIVYRLPLGSIIGDAIFPSTTRDRELVSLFKAQMNLLQEQIMGMKMRHTIGRSIKTEEESAVWEDVQRLVIYVVAGAMRTTRFVPEILRGAADVTTNGRRFSGDDSIACMSGASYTDDQQLSINPYDVFNVCVILSDGYDEEDITALHFPAESAQPRFLPASEFAVTELYAEDVMVDFEALSLEYLSQESVALSQTLCAAQAAVRDLAPAWDHLSAGDERTRQVLEQVAKEGKEGAGSALNQLVEQYPKDERTRQVLEQVAKEGAVGAVFAVNQLVKRWPKDERTRQVLELVAKEGKEGAGSAVNQLVQLWPDDERTLQILEQVANKGKLVVGSAMPQLAELEPEDERTLQMLVQVKEENEEKTELKAKSTKMYDESAFTAIE